MRSTYGMSPKSQSTFFNRLRAATCNFTGLAAILLLILSVFLAPSASAHDVLVGSDPEDGAELENPTSFTLTFNNDPLDVNPIISISGPDGQEKALDVTPIVDGRDVYVELGDLEPGEYAVSWRVVSSDGHPIEGNQSFTVLPDPAAEEPAAEGPAEEPAEDPAADDSTTEDPDAPVDSDSDTNDSETAAPNTDADTDADAEDSKESAGLPPFAWGFLGVGVLLALGIIFLSSPRSKGQHKTDDETPSEM